MQKYAKFYSLATDFEWNCGLDEQHFYSGRVHTAQCNLHGLI